MEKLNALNRAFDKAFAHTATKETLMDLLACMGEELGCDRIAIFELSADGICNNTYEWCRSGIAREKELLQGIPVSRLDSWKERLSMDEVLQIEDMESIRFTDPDVYDLFHFQNVHSVIVSKLAFHRKGLGFFVLENPDSGMIEDAGIILPGMRYILSSLVYSDSLVHRLERIGFTDRLTGTGNRVSLQNMLENIGQDSSIGVIYCECIGWTRQIALLDHMKEEHRLLRTGQVLCDIFGEDVVFRVGSEEFLVLCEGEEESGFADMKKRLCSMLTEHDLLCAVSALWDPSGGAHCDALIRQVHLMNCKEKKVLTATHPLYHADEMPDEWSSGDKAAITLNRGDKFFRQAETFLGEIYDSPVLTAVVDINYFKLYNDIFGRKAGSLLLEQTAAAIGEKVGQYAGVAGYLGGDNFCLMIIPPVTSTPELTGFIEKLFTDIRFADGFTPAMGIYLSTDRQETMITMYDRALTALAQIKGSYMDHFCFYDASHFQHLREDKLMLLDIRSAIPRGEFVFYLQPQVHERTGRIIGAEALVRWNRRDQLIPPGRFVPLLEKTGYIFAVDTHVWEQVVRWMHGRRKAGLPLVPCSVNVSRVDFYFTDVAEHFIKLLSKYDIPPRYLGIEITESAFTDNIDSILEAVRKLHDAGFRIMMDDFGSGSSSLSMLHTMHLDVLKTDVRFMSSQNTDNRAVSIVESVISMAHMIGMLVVTEGVETPEQRDNLMAIGDNYAQGFYFYKPMPVAEFEKLLQDPDKLGDSPWNHEKLLSNRLGFRAMIQEGMVSDTLLDNIIGPAAVYKEENGRLTLMQLNDQYTRLTGISHDRQDRMEHFIEKYRESEAMLIASVMHAADSHPLEGSRGFVELCREDGSKVKVDVRIFLLFSCEKYKLYLTKLAVHGSTE